MILENEPTATKLIPRNDAHGEQDGTFVYIFGKKVGELDTVYHTVDSLLHENGYQVELWSPAQVR